MSIVALILIIVVALLHGYFMLLEMALWTRPVGLQVFHQTRERAEQTQVLAANQGLYNGFIAVGLVFAVITEQRDVVLLFLGFVVIAGIYGGLTVNQRIALVQAVPAVLAILAVLFT
ncbi:MAG: DUF1304 domain-containing protein [Acidimicrobiia bacterium]|nr:DUF1304 domain-containing protein [Acidimicrobiia bacterium]